MEERQLREELARLHERLEQLLRHEPEERDLLSRLMTDLVRLAQGEAVGPETAQSLRAQVAEKVLEFEDRHPRLAGLLRELADALGRVGV
ncbi:MAG: hypothetical protein KatS3mg124_1460 [Porticoccaceae bacterium]|nr:MAG: hypothetical protein KatS3mg124_1460 [Porticoccaceae bacterium]